ncbi:MAG: Fe-S cluster assembly ATPase SufC [bacterium]
MKRALLRVENLRVKVGDKLVLKSVNLVVNGGEIVAITGVNGSGKSSLAMTLMGDVRYQMADSSGVKYEGKDLFRMTVDERARAGLYVSWQSPVTIPGVTVFSLCKAAYEARGYKIAKLTEFKEKLEELAIKVGLTKEYVTREVNVGFSGGERKRLELLQLLLLEPKLAILDEVDSGMDAQGVKIVKEVIIEMKKNGSSCILITHNQKLIDELKVDRVWKITN